MTDTVTAPAVTVTVGSGYLKPAAVGGIATGVALVFFIIGSVAAFFFLRAPRPPSVTYSEQPRTPTTQAQKWEQPDQFESINTIGGRLSQPS